MRTRIVILRPFLEEHRVDGELVHVLTCGHVVEAWIVDGGEPVGERRCEACERVRDGEGSS